MVAGATMVYYMVAYTAVACVTVAGAVAGIVVDDTAAADAVVILLPPPVLWPPVLQLLVLPC